MVYEGRRTAFAVGRDVLARVMFEEDASSVLSATLGIQATSKHIPLDTLEIWRNVLHACLSKRSQLLYGGRCEVRSDVCLGKQTGLKEVVKG